MRSETAVADDGSVVISIPAGATPVVQVPSPGDLPIVAVPVTSVVTAVPVVPVIAAVTIVGPSGSSGNGPPS